MLLYDKRPRVGSLKPAQIPIAIQQRIQAARKYEHKHANCGNECRFFDGDAGEGHKFKHKKQNDGREEHQPRPFACEKAVFDAAPGVLDSADDA